MKSKGNRNFKRVFAGILPVISLCGLLIFFTGCIKEKEEQPDVFETKSISVEINDKWFSGSSILYNKETDILFFPVSQIAPYFGSNVSSDENGNIYWDDILLPEKDGINLLERDGILYASEGFLTSDLKLNIYRGESGVYYLDNYPVLDYSWTVYRTVHHACGGIDDKSYTNSYDALVKNYDEGCRLFEIDFCLTADGVPVCAHDWDWTYQVMNLPLVEVEPEEQDETTETADAGTEPEKVAVPLTLEEFKSNTIYEKYTPMSFEELVAFMSKHDDMYVITDTKNVRDPEVTDMFQGFVDVASKSDITVLDRIIPQIYNNEMYDIISGIYDWKSVVYTFYNQGGEFRYQKVYDYSRQHGIKVFTTYTSRNDLIFINQMVDRGALIYMHTYNDMEEVKGILNDFRVWGIYTDFLPHDCMDEMPYPYVADSEE